jgi:hypothetical protein
MGTKMLLKSAIKGNNEGALGVILVYVEGPHLFAGWPK